MLENLNQFANIGAVPGGCKLRTIRESLDENDQQILDNALADVNTFSTNSLHHGLRALGIDIGYGSIARHRKQLCSCRGRNA